MANKIEFYFDLGSPTSYLAFGQLKNLSEKYDVEIEYEPVLMGAVHKATNNLSPGLIPAKGMYMLRQDLPRFVKLYDVPFKMNPAFPVNTLSVMRGCLAAKQMGIFDKYVELMFDAVWVNGLNVGKEEVLRETLDAQGIDVDKFFELIATDEIKEELKANTGKAAKKGCFGVPTMFIGDEMYFGQDRFVFIEEQLKLEAS